MTLHSNARRRRAAWAAAGLLAAAGTLGASGFPTFDVAAFGQRAVERIQSASQVTYLATIVTNTLAMLETLDDTLDHAFDVAEGAVGSVQDMASLMPGLELGQGQSLLDWKGRATRIRQRAANLASSAALPGPDAWGRCLGGGYHAALDAHAAGSAAGADPGGAGPAAGREAVRPAGALRGRAWRAGGRGRPGGRPAR